MVALAAPLLAGAILSPVAAAQALAYLLPAFLLLGVLAARWYPGERTLLRIASRRRRHRSHLAPRVAQPRWRPRTPVPRGGLLLGCSLAVRPPPRGLVVPS